MRHADPPTRPAAVRPRNHRRGSRWGRFSILWVYTYLLALDVWLVLRWAERGEDARAAGRVARIAFTLVLMVMTYLGVRWARVVLLVLLGVGLVHATWVVAAVEPNLWVPVILHAGAIYALGLSPSVADFLAGQRARRAER